MHLERAGQRSTREADWDIIEALMRAAFAIVPLCMLCGCSLLFGDEGSVIGGGDGVVLGPGAIEPGEGLLVIGSGLGDVIDTSPAAFDDADPPLERVNQRGGSEMVALIAGEIRVDGPVRVVGSRGLILVAASVTFDAVVDVSASGRTPGPGGLAAGAGGNRGGDGSAADGGGGGGAGQAGGIGSDMGQGGPAVMLETLTQERRFAGSAGGGTGGIIGCEGGVPPEDPTPCMSVGGGGGGVLVVVAGTVQVNAGGGVHAGGGGGDAPSVDLFMCPQTLAGGGGGGAGGTIALFASEEIVNAGTLAANGGGGSNGRGINSGGSASGGDDGLDGQLGIIAAAGGGADCGLTGDESCGGSGGALGALPDQGRRRANADCKERRGGGGGGAGFVLFEAPEVTEGTVSPAPVRINAP